MKKLLTLLLVLVCGVSWGAGTTVETSGKSQTVNDISAPGNHLLLAYQSANFNLDTASITTVIFNTVTVEVGNCYDETTGVFTAPKTGTYLFSAHNTQQSNAGGSFRSLFSEVFGTGARVILRSVEPGYSNSYTFLSAVGMVELAAGETVRCKVQNESGSTVVSYGGKESTCLSIYLLP